MQLSDILEENSIKAINQKTKISEENIEHILSKDFGKLKKIKALGFISIIEREYNANLSAIREEAQEYYAELGDDKSNTLGISITEEKKGKSTFFKLIILALLGYATWYFFTQFDKKQLSDMLLFIEDKNIEKTVSEVDTEDNVLDALSIGNVESKIEDEKIETIPAENVNNLQEDTSESINENTEVTENDTVMMTQTVEDIDPSEEIQTKTVSIVPVRRLWFGVVNTTTLQREHFSISKPYELDVSQKEWLIATSSAPFSIVGSDQTKEFNDANEHYLKIDVNGVVTLSKNEYIALGGWPQW